jgi:hypothetical protein
VYNPSPRIEPFPLFDGHVAWIVDDALREPQRVVELARAHRDAFAVMGHNAYPGLELRLPDAVSAALNDFFLQHLRARLGIRRVARMYSRLALLTFPPDRLGPPQWFAHRDRFGLAPPQCVAASVLYLFDDPTLGGTAFFRPRRPAAEVDRMVHDSGVLASDAFTRTYGIAPGYPRDDAWFEKVAVVPPRFNRMVFYDGGLFHAGEIPDPARLTDDPGTGRLTLNGFFTCRRAIA